MKKFEFIGRIALAMLLVMAFVGCPGTGGNNGVTTSSSNIISISAGYNHSLAIKEDGSLWAWGLNNSGQLGDGTNTNRNIPTRVGTDTDWINISAGDGHSLALKEDGSLWAWGLNDSGQLGDGTNTNRNIPTRVSTDTDWTYISAGSSRSLAIKEDGSLWAWGSNYVGSLGDGTFTDRNIPTRIGADTNWAYISAGGQYCLALKKDGSLWAWGRNNYGQLGDGTNTNYRNIPTRVGTEANWTYISAGLQYSLALKNDGSLWAWGRNDNGQLGDGTNTDRYVPTRIGIDNDWVYISAGYYFHSSAIKSDGSLWAWGSNSAGQLGDGTTTDRNVSTRIGTATNWISVSLGNFFSFAITEDNCLWAWGANRDGFITGGWLGDGTYINKNTPVQIFIP